MKPSVVIASVAALLTFFALCLLLTGAPDNAGFLASVNPVSAVEDLAFALAFAAGMPATASILTALTTLALAPVVVFLVVRRLLRRHDGQARG